MAPQRTGRRSDPRALRAHYAGAMTTSWAVVTGASAGLGAAYTRHLAAQGSNVVLVARGADAMQELALEVERAHGVQTLILPTDLADRDARAELIDRIDHLEVHTLVNNAGFGSHGQFAQLDRARVSKEVELNVLALTELTHAVVPQMLDRDRGAVINVASTAAFQPVPTMATYSATKTYVLNFSNALWAELRRTGVRVVCICPGPTDTEFFANAGNDAVMTGRREPEQVVETTFAALARRQPYVVDGTRNTVLAQANRFVPTKMALSLAKWVASH